MENKRYLTSTECKKMLEKLNDRLTAEDAGAIIVKAYHHLDGGVKRHSYTDIGDFVKENIEKGLEPLFENLDNSNKLFEYKNEKEFEMIICKIKDHLNLEMARFSQYQHIQAELDKIDLLALNLQADMMDATEEATERIYKDVRKIDEKISQVNKETESLDEKISRVNKETEALDGKIKELNELKAEVEGISKVNKENVTNIKTIQSDIMKEAIAISGVIVTVISFLLANVGIVSVINGNSIINNTPNIFKLVVQINALMAIGVSTFMIIVAAFIHKSGSEEKFVTTAKFITPICIIGVSVIVLWLSANVKITFA